MLDLLLALVWTIPCLAALIAAAAAVAALLHVPRLALPLVLVAVILFGVAYVTRIHDELATSRAEALAAKADAAAKGRSIEALQRNTKSTAARAKATRTRRDRIVAAPASDDGPVAWVLNDTLEALR